MLPDNKLGAQKEEEEKQRLASYRETLSDEDIQATIVKTQELKERQVSDQIQLQREKLSTSYLVLL